MRPGRRSPSGSAIWRCSTTRPPSLRRPEFYFYFRSRRSIVCRDLFFCRIINIFIAHRSGPWYTVIVKILILEVVIHENRKSEMFRLERGDLLFHCCPGSCGAVRCEARADGGHAGDDVQAPGLDAPDRGQVPDARLVVRLRDRRRAGYRDLSPAGQGRGCKHRCGKTCKVCRIYRNVRFWRCCTGMLVYTCCAATDCRWRRL